MTRWVLVVAMATAATLIMGGDALPLSADGVVPEDEWSPAGNSLGLTGQNGLGAKIASLQKEEQEQRRKEDKEMLGTHFVRKPQVDGVKMVDQFMDVQEDAQNEDLLKGISHDADVIGAIVDKADKAEKKQAAAAAKPAKPVHTLVMHMKDGQPLVAVEAGSKAGGKAASKAASKATSKATSKAGAEKQPMFTNYAKSIDKQEKDLIDKEMAKPLEGEPKQPPAKKDAAPKPADTKQPSTPQGKQPQPIVIHSDEPLTPVTHRNAASAASQAVTAAGRAVNTLEDMKAAADADVATGAAPTPSPALVHERIMEQAQASAAKTLARLNKKEAQDEAKQAADGNSEMSEMFEAALAPPVVEVPLTDAQQMAKITAKYLGTDSPAVPEGEETELVQVKEMSTVDAGASVSEKEAAEAKIYAEATAHALAKAKAKFGFGAIFGGYDYGYGGSDKHDDHKDEKKAPPAAGSAAGSGSMPAAAPMTVVHHMAGGKGGPADKKMKKKMFEGLNQLDGVMVTKSKPKAHKKMSPEDFMKGFLSPAQDIAHNDAERDIEDMTDPDENEQLWQDADTALESLGFPTMREGGLY